jgi:hypothetical protein
MPRSEERPRETVRRLLRAAVCAPEDLPSWSNEELDLVLRLARRVRLLGRIAARLERVGLLASLPAPARDQLESALVVVHARSRVTRWELDRLARALAALRDKRMVALKGSAYLLADLPNAEGRVFADVDLLFDEATLAEAERVLVEQGWRGTKLSPYDQHYYRAWTHELPPLVHVEREVEADLHHNILPRTSRLKPNGRALFEAAVPIPGQPFSRLCNSDVVLHAMTHLMFDSEMADALRDLVDINDLLRHFAAGDATFWERLARRAAELDLERPMFYALRYAALFLDTPVPSRLLERSAKGAPPRAIAWLMDRLVPLALFPAHPDQPSPAAAAARFMLYVRSLWIRMPPLLLARHLAYKAYVRRFGREPARDA